MPHASVQASLADALAAQMFLICCSHVGFIVILKIFLKRFEKDLFRTFTFLNLALAGVHGT